ncbi:MAG: hypothetical protein GY822_06685 [Deltaproteobacteria bacterium]|nr:hypothetical protein [Deltaproteobacteria bacterium]
MKADDLALCGSFARDKAEHGGLQIVVHPMKKSAYEKHFPSSPPRSRGMAIGGGGFTPGSNKMTSSMPMMSKSSAMPPPSAMPQSMAMPMASHDEMEMEMDCLESSPSRACEEVEGADMRSSSRCFIHLCNSIVWSELTGEKPPGTAPTAREYANHGLPWFDYYSDDKAVQGSKVLNEQKSRRTNR